jgi:hypothetical protein
MSPAARISQSSASRSSEDMRFGEMEFIGRRRELRRQIITPKRKKTAKSGTWRTGAMKKADVRNDAKAEF